jgi:hypothetical protein
MVVDTRTNTKLVYLYTKHFKWTEPANHEIMLGNPKPNKVYQAIKNTDAESYRVFYKIEGQPTYQGVFLSHIKSDSEKVGFVGDMVEITTTNILDFELSPEELTKLYDWIKDGSKDLMTELNAWFDKQDGAKTSNKKGGDKKNLLKNGERPVDVAIGALRGYDPNMGAALATLDDLRTDQPRVFEALAEVCHHLLTKALDFENPAISLRLDQTHGTGVNLSSAMEKLVRYLGPDRRSNLNKDDLTGAVQDLLTEIYRLNYHEGRH